MTKNYGACPACGHATYLEKNGRCYGCQYPQDPAMRAWVEKQLQSPTPNPHIKKETR